ncbi:bifunctional methylenetetrahydrofolate dehydrogenase/methenyltetrahydrofolate cyclohydrolase FolD [Campylobacter coli]|uniref:bifunctional methylenetetrahydrofolate dehydrogenase/methenyltetrahydrofolate cyclohydrolase FolD n=1 Tax=Campylobacter coli TaxID=195 RepID=UPI003B9808F8
MTLLDGKTLSAKIKQELKEKNKMLKENGVETCLAVILVGNDPASQTYVNSKAKACEECDIKSLVYRLDENTTQNELLALINTLNHDDSVHGILVQLPLPKHISKDLILESIISKDVDGFHPINVGYLNLGLESGFLPCTPLGVMKLLKAYDINLEGLDSVVIGASNIVGRPMATMLLNAGCTVSICHIKTKDLSAYTQKADLIIVAAGCVNLLRADMVKEGAIIIDVGINRLENGKIVGDVDFEEVSKKASFITPVPGGVGPMTIAMLLENTVKSAKNSLKSGI